MLVADGVYLDAVRDCFDLLAIDLRKQGAASGFPSSGQVLGEAVWTFLMDLLTGVAGS